MKRVLWLLVVLSAATNAWAADPQSLLGTASTAFQAGKYDEAMAAYREAVEAGANSADLQFNLGTSALRAGRRGEAILAFERALRLDPDDADAAFNLAEASKGNIDKIVGAREEAPLLERLGARVPASVGHLFVASWWIALAALFLRSRVPRHATLLAFAGGLSLLVATVSGALAWSCAYHRSTSRHAIVVAASTAVREGPAADFKAAFEIHEGLKVRVVRRENDFVRVRLPNGVEGWVDVREVPPI